MITLIFFLVGRFDPTTIAIALSADGVVFGGLALWVALRPPTDRIVHGFLRTPDRDVHHRRYVLALQGRLSSRDVDLISITFSAPLQVRPHLDSGGTVDDWAADGDPRRVGLRDVQLRRAEDIEFNVRFAGPLPADVRVQRAGSSDPQLECRDLSFLRPQVLRRVVGAAVLTAALVVTGVIVAINVVDPAAPLVGRILIASALVPIGFGLASSRLLDRY